VADGKLQKTCETEGSFGVSFLSLSFSSDGNYLAAGREGNSIYLCSFPEGRLLKTLIGHTGNVNSVCFHPVKNMLASGSSDKTIKLWEWSTYTDIEPNLQYNQFLEEMSSLVHANDQYIICKGIYDNDLAIIDLEQNRIAYRITGQFIDLTSVLLSNNSRHALIGDTNGIVKWCNITDSKIKDHFKAGDDGIKEMRMIHDNSVLVTVGENGKIRFWSFPQPELIKELEGLTIALNWQENRYALLKNAHSVTVGTVDDSEPAKELVFEEEIRSFQFSPVTEYLILGTDRGIIQYDHHKQKMVKKFETETPAIDVAVSNDEKYIAMTYVTDEYDGETGFILFDVAKNLRVASQSFPKQYSNFDKPGIEFLNNGKILYINNEIKIFEFTDLKEDIFLSNCLYDKAELEDEIQGIRYTVGSETRTLPCGSPIPAGAVCTCNCITVGSPRTYYYGSYSYYVTYWYPN
jgi:hypothetical protein